MLSGSLLEQLDQLLGRVSQVDLSVSEETHRIPQVSEVAPAVLELLDAAVSLLSQAQKHYESEAALEAETVDDSDSLSDIGALISTEMAARGLADLAFVARGDLLQCREELHRACAKDDFLQMASRSDTGFRHLRRALMSLESAIYEFLGSPAPMRRWFDLSVSLEIRRLYGRLRNEIAELDGDRRRGPEDRLRITARRFSELRGLRVYPLLRIDDRVAVRQLYKRILEWQEAGGGDLLAAARLWQDIVGFTELLVQVNHRQELREHDLKTVLSALRRLNAVAGTPGPLPTLVRQELAVLEGLDAELDELLGAEPGAEAPQEQWQAVLGRLQWSLSPRKRDGSTFPRGY